MLVVFREELQDVQFALRHLLLLLVVVLMMIVVNIVVVDVGCGTNVAAFADVCWSGSVEKRDSGGSRRSSS